MYTMHYNHTAQYCSRIMSIACDDERGEELCEDHNVFLASLFLLPNLKQNHQPC